MTTETVWGTLRVRVEEELVTTEEIMDAYLDGKDGTNPRPNTFRLCMLFEFTASQCQPVLEIDRGIAEHEPVRIESKRRK